MDDPTGPGDGSDRSCGSDGGDRPSDADVSDERGPEPYQLEPIGVVSTPFDELDDAPRQGGDVDDDRRSHRGEIVLFDRFRRGLAGLDAGDRVDVLWIADRADRSTLTVRDGRRGVFGTRSPARPNPICVTPCRIVQIEGSRLVVSGVDMLDGSPVVDLKAPLRTGRDRE